MECKKVRELSTTTRTSSNLENSNIQVLVLNADKVMFAEVAMENCVVLIRGRKNILNAKRPVAETNVLGCRRFALAPTTFYVEMLMH